MLSVASDTATSLLVTFIGDMYDINNVHTVQVQTSYRVTTAGAVTLVSMSTNNYGNGISIDGTTPYDITYTFH